MDMDIEPTEYTPQHRATVPTRTSAATKHCSIKEGKRVLMEFKLSRHEKSTFTPQNELAFRTAVMEAKTIILPTRLASREPLPWRLFSA